MAFGKPHGFGLGGGGSSSVKVSAGSAGVQGQVTHHDDNINAYINRPPDPRLNSIIKKMGLGLKLGIVQQTDEASRGNNQTHPYACRFHFNPPAISVAYSVATGVLPANQLTVDQLAASAIYPGQTSVSFGLLFDRTYEVAYGPGQTNPQDLRKIGVYHDIEALERVVGVKQKWSYTDQTTNPDGTAKSEGKTDVQGNMLMLPVYLIFGGGPANSGLAFVGFFTSMNVTYTLFSQNMVPTRATVELGFQQLVGANSRDYTKGGGTLIDRAHAAGRTTTSSGQNVALSPYGTSRHFGL